ncbi:hypothetical protein F2Q70_00033401 [Brassica cretica]|uniref:Uncharacterized protein n=1 Tax=Brassica cretica TaxID=69181 RepID=A0A8S9FKA0_BRACR|nr:hypothetical protein F2Q70_00033401 [Brassica cretica]
MIHFNFIFWHYLFHLFARSLVFSSLSPISSIFLLTDKSSEILLSHSYSPITSAVLLSHRLFNPHLRISQTRRLSSPPLLKSGSHHYHDLTSSSLGCAPEENFDIAEMCRRCYEPEVEEEADAVQNKMAEARSC